MAIGSDPPIQRLIPRYLPTKNVSPPPPKEKSPYVQFFDSMDTLIKAADRIGINLEVKAHGLGMNYSYTTPSFKQLELVPAENMPN